MALHSHVRSVVMREGKAGRFESLLASRNPGGLAKPMTFRLNTDPTPKCTISQFSLRTPTMPKQCEQCGDPVTVQANTAAERGWREDEAVLLRKMPDTR